MAEAEAPIYVGRKNTSNYVVAVITQFNAGAKRVVLKARGRSITRAVDTAEWIKRIWPGKVEVAKVTIGSDKVGEPGKERTVSTIEIVLERKD